MRKPVEDPLEWWRSALKGEAVAVMDDPQPGFFRRRLVRGGPFVPVKVWLEQSIDVESGEIDGDSVLKCIVDGFEANPEDHWTYICDQPISEEDYEYLWRLSDYARLHDRREPLANPRKKINLMTVPFPTFKKSKGKKP